jgi:tetratricopeptide (TPR) repeat protein
MASLIARTASVLAGLAFAFSLLVPRLAFAEGANDGALKAIIRDIYKSEVAKNKLKNALANLDAAGGVCEGGACSDEAQAELWVAIGMVQAKQGKASEAKTSFTAALKLDPQARLRTQFVDDKVQAAWDDAKSEIANRSETGCRGSYEKTEPPDDWRSGEAYYCYKQAKKKSGEGNYADCAEDARAALELEEQLRSRAVLASCLEDGNQWKEAIDQYRELSRRGAKAKQYNESKKWALRATSLQQRMPRLAIEQGKEVDDLIVKLDGAELPIEVLGIEIEVDPGEHTVTAEGTEDGLPMGFEDTVRAEPNRTSTVRLNLTPGSPDAETQRFLRCRAEGKALEDCLGKTEPIGGNLKFRVALEASGYHDTMDVDVATPSISTGVEHVTDGWGINASFLVDVVTAASVDILATASPHWREVRWVPALSAHVGAGDFDFAIHGNLSHEPDYLATSVGATISADFAQKTVTPSIGYEYSHDINARSDTPFDVYSLTIDRHAINLGLGLVADKATFMSFAYTMVFENGDGSKPYRHVPMFAPEVAPLVEPGLTIDAVNFFREPERPLEQLPVSRKRFALAFLIAHRFSSATFRVSERAYFDSWGTKATTTDLKLYYDIIKEFRIWPHVRFHAQSAADFYQLAYVAERTADGVKIPPIRTGDRELGPLVGVTFGGGARVEFGSQNQYGLMTSGDVAYTRFLEHLFVKERWGFFGALNFDAEFE